MEFFLFLLLSLFFSTCHIRGDTFSAVCKVEKLVTTEKKLISALFNYIKEETRAGRQVSDNLQKFSKNIKTKIKYAKPTAEYCGNPINAFHILDRFVNKWKPMFDEIFCSDCERSTPLNELNTTVAELERKIFAFPNERDLNGVSVSILRLWSFYRMDVADIINGKIKHTLTDRLESSEIVYIARAGEDRGMYYEEIMWLRILLDLFESGLRKDDGMKQFFACKQLARSYFLYDMPWKSVDVIGECLRKDPNNRKLENDRNWYQSKVDSLDDSQWNVTLRPTDYKTTHHEQFDVYTRLCNGDEMRTSAEMSKLKCFSRRSKIPFMRGKEEVLNFNPRLSIYHGVISDREIATVRSLGEAKMTRSQHLSSSGTKVIDDSYRISQTGWISDDEHPLINKLSRRIEVLTGLALRQTPVRSDCEKLQVLNYGIGGMYEPHTDYFGVPLGATPSPSDPVELQDTGDRIATWLYYLSDVEYGGSTVYPYLRIHVPVTKGAAAFWYNLRRNGTPDSKTLHAACPVLLGSKWVSNKWIREGGQMHNRPCGMHLHEVDYPIE